MVDDASTDTTVASIAAITDRRITLIRHDERRGGSAARNTGIRASSAPFIAFLDSDDEWLPSKLERQMEVFARSDERLGLVYTGTELTFADGRVRNRIRRQRACLVRMLLRANVLGGTSVGMIRRSTIDTVGGFDEALPAKQDVDLWLRIAERFRVDVVPEVLVRTAKGNDSGQISANLPGTMEARELFYRKHRDKLIREGVLHLYLRDTGWAHQHRLGDTRTARRFYLDSIAARPAALFTYVLLMAGFVPPSWLKRVARWKHRAAALMHSGLTLSFGSR